MASARLESNLRTLELALRVNDVGIIRTVIVRLVSGCTPSDEIVGWVFIEQEAETDRLGLGNSY